MRHFCKAAQVRVAALLAASVLISVVAGCGGSSSSSTTSSSPGIDSISPTSGAASGGTAVTITGSNLNSTSSVLFGSVAATSYTVDSSTQITAISPPGSGGVVISVTTPNGTADSSFSQLFTYGTVSSTGPTISGISPNTAASGATVTITGTNLTGTTEVEFGSTPASFTVNSTGTSITATVPSLGSSSGTYNVTAVTPNGTSSGYAFTYSG